MKLKIINSMHMQGITDFESAKETIGVADGLAGDEALLSFMKVQSRAVDCLSTEALIARGERWAKLISSLEPNETLELRIDKVEENDFKFFNQPVQLQYPELEALATHALQTFGFDKHFVYPVWIILRSDAAYVESMENYLTNELLRKDKVSFAGLGEEARVRRFLGRVRMIRQWLENDFILALPKRQEICEYFDAYYGLGRAAIEGKEVRNSRFNQDLLQGSPDIGETGIENEGRHGIVIELAEFRGKKKYVPAEKVQGIWTDNHHHILKLNFPLTAVYRYRRRPTELALDRLHRQEDRAMRQKEEALSRRQLQELKSRESDRDSKEDLLEMGAEVEIAMSFDALIYDSDLNVLDERKQQLLTAFKDSGLKGEIVRRHTAFIKWLKLAPGGELNNVKPLQGQHTEAFTYFNAGNPFADHQAGLPILIKTSKGLTPAVINRWQSGFLNRHIRIDGETGAGKTVLASAIIEQDMKQLGMDYVVADFQDSFKRRAQFLPGAFYMDASEKHFLDYLNLFNCLRAPNQKTRDFFLDANFKFMLDMLGRKPSNEDPNKINKIEITEPQETLIWQSLMAFYDQAKADNVFMQEFYEFLLSETKHPLEKIFQTPEDKDFRCNCHRVIYKYLNFTILKEYFDPGNKNWIPLDKLDKANFAVFGLKAIRNNEAIKPLYMNPLLTITYKRLYSPYKTGIFVDEGHKAASDPMLAMLLNDIKRMGRQNDMAFMFASHELVDDNTQFAKALRMPQFIWLAPHAQGQLQALTANNSLTGEQLDVLMNCDPSTHEYGLLLNRKMYAVRLRLDRYAMPLFETDPDNVRNFQGTWDKRGDKFAALDEIETIKWEVN